MTVSGTGTSIASMPFEFNPPIHPSLNHIYFPQTSGNSTVTGLVMKDTYDETRTSYTANESSDFRTLRLGRIVMSDESLAFALRDRKRYGFRFLYNPSTVSGGSGVGGDFVVDPQNAVTAVLTEGLEVISFELFLCRVPEVMGGGASTGDYPTPVSSTQMNQIKERGTHYDLEYLYRCCNGIHNTKARKDTGDIGILLPNPVELYLGPLRSRGALLSVSVRDMIFSPDMVPALTLVHISFARYLSVNPSGVPKTGTPPPTKPSLAITPQRIEVASTGVAKAMLDAIKAALGGLGSAVWDSLSSADSGSGGANLSAPPLAAIPSTSTPMTGSQVENLAKSAGFSPSEAEMMTRIAWRESRWNPRAHNPKPPDNSYGLWQINMYGNLGPSRRSAYGLTSNEQLFDPATNARVARGIFRSSGYKAWSTYSSLQPKNW